MPDQIRKLAAIMFTDIAGYTALMDKNEEQAFALLQKNRSIHKSLIEIFHGKFLKEMGDGILASFTTVSDAVYCAGAIQKACENEPNLNLRIGIHQGEVVSKGADVFGSGVNIASRIEVIAPVGGIWVSDSVQRNIQNKKGIVIEFVKEETLKNVQQPVRIYEVKVNTSDISIPQVDESSDSKRNNILKLKSKSFFIIAIGAALIISIGFFSIEIFKNENQFENNAPQSKIVDKSIAVMPFADMSPDKDQEYFSDGIAEEIINALTQIPNLKVASRTSAFQFRGEDINIKTIGEALSVATILEGSIRKSNNKVRVTAQLINVEDGFYLWSHTYERELNDIFAIQDELSRSIVNAFQLQISDNSTSLVKDQTTNIAAYNLYLQGRYFWNRRTKEGIQKSIDFFVQAIDEDSLYALAYSGLSDAYNVIAWWGYLEPKVAFPKAKAAAIKALDINNSSGQAYAGLAYIQTFYEWDRDEAERSFQSAHNFSPNYSTAHQWHALLLRSVRKPIRAMNEINKAIELDPLSPIINFDLSLHYLWDGNHKKAIEQANNILEMNSNFYLAHYSLYMTFYDIGDFDLAFKHFIQWRASYSEDSVILKKGYMESGWSGAAKRMIPILETRSKDVYVNPMHIALYYLHLNDNKKALDYLEKAFEQRIPAMNLIGVYPVWKTLYSEPRFQAILKKMGLPQPL